ncbi:Kunitz protease inhibitor [Heracleum sosnowskyi]|uniref:Kunitz protease inhibitor n=1 Tax=Heracleum sosnowskyi TaxID=360622 RepID=A0AAD8NDW3_9APIA|nr:Kunitz protease inhibitor [Heracleum sosnowskyi]
MKPSVFLFSFLLILVTNHLVASAASNRVVLDIDEKELRTGTNYFILPVVRGNGGGLKLYSGRTSQCPLDVVQEPNEVNRGIPVTFTPTNPREPTIRVSSDLNIKFSGASICAQSTVWRLDGKGAASGQLFVSTGGVLGNPSGATISNWFRIEKLQGRNNNYKLVYCPRVCNTCKPVCGDLGIVIEKSGTRRLALNTGKPFQVLFKKA